MVEGRGVCECRHIVIYLYVISAVMDKHAHTHTHTHTNRVHSCWSWCILLCPSAVALWRVYCSLRAGGQPSIIYWLSAERDTGTYPCIPSFLSFSHLVSFILPSRPFLLHFSSLLLSLSFFYISPSLAPLRFFALLTPSLAATLDCDLTIFISAIYVCQHSFCPRETMN